MKFNKQFGSIKQSVDGLAENDLQIINCKSIFINCKSFCE